MCANDVAVAPGRIVYTQWLNERGGIEADLTVTRLAEDAYLIVTSAASQTRDFSLAEAPHPGRRPRDRDRRDLGLRGARADGAREPRSAGAVDPGGSVQRRRSRSARRSEIELGYALVRAQRISYVGELGCELYVPTEFAGPVFDVIAEAAGDRLAFAGFHALNSLRLEKGYRHFGHDIGDEDTPLEAGLGFACAFDKGVPFIGRDALLQQRERAPTQAPGPVQADGPGPLLFHDEPIVMDGERIGLLTSGSYGHTLGAAIGMGWVRHPDGVTPDLLRAARFEIEIAGERYPAEASLRAFYDPTGARMRA